MDRLDVVNSFWFVAWLAALAVLFVLGARLPLQPRLRRPLAVAYGAAIVLAPLGIAVRAHVARGRHDAPFDLTPQAELWIKRREPWLHPVEGASQHEENRR